MSTSQIIASRRVSQELQEAFAALSGDRNPMHMDAVAARRTQAGLPVVHGVHTLLWALESLVAAGHVTSAPPRIRAKFLKWVYLDDEAVLSFPVATTATATFLQVDVLGMTVLSAEIFHGEPAAFTAETALVPSPAEPLPAALDLLFAELQDRKGEAYTASAAQVKALFPRLCGLMGSTAVAEIVACSYIVGMEAPGLHSMFSKLDLSFAPVVNEAADRAALHYEVSYLDERFRKGRVSVTGRAATGTLEVFIRVPPVQQASMELISQHVTAGEFAGVNALIIGGSRGLGELTAKLIAAGGGTSNITYALGKVEAEEVASQIRQSGGQASTLEYDVRKAPGAQLEGLSARPTHLFYFATSIIYKPKLAVLSPSALADFTQFYLQGFYDLCVALTSPALEDGRKLIVFYPSTVFIEARPAGMTEYAMVKAAGEQLCVDMNTYLPGVHVLAHRLPKLATDQTAGVIPERETDAIEALLPSIRKMVELSAPSK
jgi:acyl dehydratase